MQLDGWKTLMSGECFRKESRSPIERRHSTREELIAKDDLWCNAPIDFRMSRSSESSSRANHRIVLETYHVHDEQYKSMVAAKCTVKSSRIKHHARKIYATKNPCDMVSWVLNLTIYYRIAWRLVSIFNDFRCHNLRNIDLYFISKRSFYLWMIDSKVVI